LSLLFYGRQDTKSLEKRPSFDKTLSKPQLSPVPGAMKVRS
jgi:hypothetical protein